MPSFTAQSAFVWSNTCTNAHEIHGSGLIIYSGILNAWDVSEPVSYAVAHFTKGVGFTRSLYHIVPVEVISSWFQCLLSSFGGFCGGFFGCAMV